MSRIFTIWFDFEDQSYMGIVTMVVSGEEFILKVGIKEDNLLKILRGKYVVVSTTKGILVPEMPYTDRVCSLVLKIVESVASHLSSHSSNKGLNEE